MRLGHLFALAFVVAGCKLYNPEVVDCSIHCGDNDACPVDLVCKQGFCRVASATTQCDCHTGDSRACGAGKGECTAGIQQCGSDGTWSVCIGAGKPTDETCDNKDNNCNGLIDDNVTGAPACSKTAGVCASAVQTCVSGGFIDCTTADYGPDYQVIETKCDGLDNDCDGVVDQTREKIIASGVTGNWELFAYPDGVALVVLVTSATASGKLDLDVVRFDQTFGKLSTAVVATVDPGTVVAARNDGSDVAVAWNSPGKLNLAVAAVEGTVRSLGSLAVTDAPLPGMQLGLSPTQAVATYTLANDLAAVLWPRDGGSQVLLLLSRDFTDGGLDGIAGVTASLASQGGHYFSMSASVNTAFDDGGVSTDSFYDTFSADSLALVSTGTDPGYQRSNVVEQPFGKILSFYDDYFFLFGSSGIYEVDLSLSGAANTALIVGSDSHEYRDVNTHAVATANGALVTYTDNMTNRLTVTSQNLSGVRHSLQLDHDGGVGPPRIAWDTTSLLAVAFELGGTIYARRLCSP
jgi:hypothetical protein